LIKCDTHQKRQLPTRSLSVPESADDRESCILLLFKRHRCRGILLLLNARARRTYANEAAAVALPFPAAFSGVNEVARALKRTMGANKSRRRRPDAATKGEQVAQRGWINLNKVRRFIPATHAHFTF